MDGRTSTQTICCQRGGVCFRIAARGREILNVGIDDYWKAAKSDGVTVTLLGDLYSVRESQFPAAASHDGSVIVGDVENEAFIWTEQVGMRSVGFLPGYEESYATDVSGDGNVVVGQAGGVLGTEAFTWSNGSITGLGHLSSDNPRSRALATNQDGSIIVGESFAPTLHPVTGELTFTNNAFIWDATNGMRSLRDVLVTDFGLGQQLDGWFLSRARGVSDDGRVIVGQAINFDLNVNPNLLAEPFIVRLDAFGDLACDFNSDDLCDLIDIDRLYDDIAAGALGGPTDLDGNGIVDNDDIDEWLSLAGTENGKSYLPGDTNLNGEVGGSDFTALAQRFGNIGSDPDTALAYWRHGNFDGMNSNGDFDVGGPDFTALALNFGHVSVQAVPEPEGLGWLFLGWMIWCAGHRRMGR